MLPRPELRGPVANGQSPGQLHRWLRRARLSDIPEHRESATSEETDHSTTHQDSKATSQTARLRAAATHERRAPCTGRFRRDSATRATDLDSGSDSTSGQYPRTIYRKPIQLYSKRPRLPSYHAGIAIAQQLMRSKKLRKYLNRIILDLVTPLPQE